MTKFFKLVYPPYPPKTTAINNLIRKYFFYEKLFKYYFFYFLSFFNALFSIFHTESLVKMSNSLWFSRIFTLQSSSWFCFIFIVFLRCTWKKITTRMRILFYNHWIWKFSKFQFFSFPFLNFIDFKITTNSFIYSLVEQFLETHFHKNNYRG